MDSWCSKPDLSNSRGRDAGSGCDAGGHPTLLSLVDEGKREPVDSTSRQRTEDEFQSFEGVRERTRVGERRVSQTILKKQRLAGTDGKEG